MDTLSPSQIDDLRQSAQLALTLGTKIQNVSARTILALLDGYEGQIQDLKDELRELAEANERLEGEVSDLEDECGELTRQIEQGDVA